MYYYVGYLMFGDNVNANILNNFPYDNTFANIARYVGLPSIHDALKHRRRLPFAYFFSILYTTFVLQ